MIPRQIKWLVGRSALSSLLVALKRWLPAPCWLWYGEAFKERLGYPLSTRVVHDVMDSFAETMTGFVVFNEANLNPRAGTSRLHHAQTQSCIGTTLPRLQSWTDTTPIYASINQANAWQRFSPMIFFTIQRLFSVDKFHYQFLFNSMALYKYLKISPYVFLW